MEYVKAGSFPYNQICFLYPVILLLRAALFKSTGEATSFLMGLYIMFTGYIVTKLILVSKQNFARLLASYLLGLIPAALYVIIFLNKDSSTYGILRALFEGIVAFLLYFTGVRTRFLGFDQILSRKTIIFGVIIFLASIIFIDYNKELEYLKNAIYLSGYVFIALTLLIKNQQNLDRAFIKKYIDISTVPKDIRNYNSIMVIVVFLVMLVLFNIRSLVAFITTIFKNMPKCILNVIFTIIYILSKLLPEAAGGGAQEKGEPQMPLLPEGESNSIAGLILTIIFGLFFLIVVIFLIPKVPKLLRIIGEKIRKFALLIVNFIERLFKIQKDYIDREDDYIDEVEIIKPDSTRNSSRKGLNKSGLVMKIINRKFGKNLSPSEKVRNMYADILHHLKIRGVKIIESDTTNEIYRKIPKVGSIDEIMKYITKVYEEVRYGEKIPEETELEQYKDSVRHAMNTLSSAETHKYI